MSLSNLSIFEQMARKRGQRKGHLFSRSGSWLLRYWVDSPDEFDEEGKPTRERVTVTIALSHGPQSISKREAERIAWDEFLSPLDAANTRPSSGKPFREFLDKRFRPDVIETLKPTGKAFYESILRRHIVPTLGKVKLRDITAERVQALLTAKGRSGLSTQTVVHIRNCISAVLRHAKSMNWFFGELPTSAVRLPQMVREKLRTPTWDQVCMLAAAVPEPVSTLVLFLALTGLRIGEAMGLRVKRLNLSDSDVVVDGEVIPARSVAVRENYVMGRYSTLKTPTSVRNVPIPEWFVPRLAATLLRRDFKVENPSASISDAPVFVNISGTAPVDQHNTAARTLKPAAVKLKIPWISWHRLRHAQASFADAAGISVAERQKILGHASPAMALHYTTPDLDRLRGRMETMVDSKKVVN